MLLERLSSLGGLLRADAQLGPPFAAFARALVLPQLRLLGWEPKPEDGHLTRKLRGELVPALPSLCGAGAPSHAPSPIAR